MPEPQRVVIKAQGKDVIELQIGDSPFSSTASALDAGAKAIRDGQTHYCPSMGLMSFRETVAANYKKEYGIDINAENVVVGPGAKVFEQFFCEAFLDPGDAVLLFSPHFPTYPPNIERRGGQLVYSDLKQANQFRPDLNDGEHFVKNNPKARAIFLNSPHNPRRRGDQRGPEGTGGPRAWPQHRSLPTSVQPWSGQRASSVPGPAGYDGASRRLLYLQPVIQAVAAGMRSATPRSSRRSAR
jgi:hypothetical protein